MSPDEPTTRRLVLPPVLLGRFADGAGQVMAERRDRGRRLLVPVAQATADAGAFTVALGGTAVPALERLLADVDARAGLAIEALLAGDFPPAPPDRAVLALLLGLQLLTGRGHRERAIRAAALLGQVIAGNLPDGDEAEDDEAEVADEPDEEAEVETAEEADEAAESEAEAEDDAVEIGIADTPLDLTPIPELARLLAARTWQLVRFAAPILLTGDTPAVLWSRPGASAHRWGLGGADEVRIPLDPRHALIVARHAPAGEVVRDLEERHARALNRTVAEATHLWMYYHPASDPLERVELASS